MPESRLMFRRAVPGDLPDINRLLRQVLEVHHEGRPDLFKGGVKKYTDEELERIIADDERPVFVCDTGAGVCGYAFCVFVEHPDDNILTPIKTLYIDDLCVDEDSRGKGIGRFLYENVKAFARARGCYNITLNVWSSNTGAERFYQKLGLRPQKTGMEEILL